MFSFKFIRNPIKTIKDTFNDAVDYLEDVVNVVTEVVGEVISWLIDIPEIPDIGQSAQSVLVNKNSNIASIPVIYGQRKVGGTRVFVETSGSENKYLYICLVLCEGEVDSIGEVFINDEALTGSAYESYVSLDKKTGSDSQSASSVLTAAPSWDSNNRLRGIAYLGIRLEFNRDVFSSIPTITAIVNGKPVYDPRTQTTSLSSNPALCLRDYLTNTRYGKGLDSSLIDDDSFSDAADACDTDVTNYDGSGQTVKRFSCNAVINTDQSLFNNVKSLLSSMQGMMPYQNGQYRLVIDDDYDITFDFDTDNIISGFKIQGSTKGRKFNAVTAKFINPEANWQADAVIWPEPDSSDYSTFLSEDNQKPLETELNLQFTTSYYQARNIAKTACLASRKAGLQISFTATPDALKCAVGDIVTVTHPTPSFTNKEFRVTGLTINYDATVNVSLAEHNATIYPWVSDKEEPDTFASNLPDPLTVEPPVLSVSDELRVLNQEAVSFLIANVSTSDSFAERFEVQSRRAGETEFVTMGQAGGGIFEQVNIVDGDTYTVRARVINSLGVRSAFTTVTHDVVGKTAPPADVTNLSANVINGQVQLSWTPVTDLDLSHYLVRYQNVTTGASYENANNVVEKVARPANSLATEARAGTYFVRAVDKLGLPSANPTSIVITTDMLVFDNLNVVETDTENPTFGGVTNNVAVVDNSLVLDTSLLFDDATGNFDDFTGNFDGGGGNVTSSGTYDFADIIDLSEKYTSRVIADVTTGRREYINLFDDTTGNFDDREGKFDGEQAAFDTTDVQLYVRTSDTGSNPIAPEFGLTLSQTIPNATRIEGSEDTDPNINTPERSDVIHFQVDSIILPTAATAQIGGLFEMGGGGVGSFVGIRNVGSDKKFRVRAGDGASSYNVNDTVILDIDIATSPYFDGNAHKLNWEFEPDGTAYIKLWIDNVLVGTANTADNTNMEGGNWHGGGDGFYGTATFSQINVGGEPTGAWQHGTPSGLKVYERQGSTYDPSVWTDYRRFVVGDYSARSFQFRAELTTSQLSASPVVTGLSATVDMPDRIDEKRQRSTTGGVNNGTFNYPFKAIPTLAITLTNGQQGDYYTISNITTDGYTINMYDSGGNPVSRTYDIMAKGYGRRIT